MYYKSVNRGLMFTKAGIYCIGYVMALGLLAMLSGVNALYLFLSTGMALLIISGILSERIMRLSDITSLEEKTVNADSPFTIGFAVSNRAKRFTTFGLESHFFLQRPKIKIISHPLDAPIAGRALRLAPGETQTFKAHCHGMTRGFHTKILSYQKTGYPFGFLEKFKINKLSCRLAITPAIDAKILADLAKSLLALKRQHEDQMDFYGHRNYNAHDSLRHVDWRRSASKGPNNWVVKQYRSDADLYQFRVTFNSSELRHLRSDQEYEKFLVRVRTAIEAVRLSGFQAVLTIDGDKNLDELKAILHFLAGLPKWQDAKSIDDFMQTVSFCTSGHVAASIEINQQGFEVITAPGKGQVS